MRAGRAQASHALRGEGVPALAAGQGRELSPLAAARRGWEATLARAEAQDLRRQLRPTERLGPERVRVAGRQAVSFGSCDYLGLAGHRALAEAAAEAARREGTSAGSARLLTGQTPRMAALEADLAAAFGGPGQQAALVFGSGYLANLALITTLAGAGDLILSDRRNHASSIDACRLSGAEVRVFAHNDAPDLARGLADAHRFGRVLVLVEGVYSMDGDLAPLDALCAAAEAAGALLVVDDAHGLGVLGEHGRGACEACGVEGRVAARVGNLGKALGSYGAFVLADPALRDLLVQAARSFVFTCALPPPVLAAAGAALQLLREQPGRRERLADNARCLRRGLHQQGLLPADHAASEPPTPIVAVPVGAPGKALELSEQLLQRGWLVPALRPPSVPEGRAGLRLTVSAAHTAAQCEGVATDLGEALRAL